MKTILRGVHRYWMVMLMFILAHWYFNFKVRLKFENLIRINLSGNL